MSALTSLAAMTKAVRKAERHGIAIQSATFTDSSFATIYAADESKTEHLAYLLGLSRRTTCVQNDGRETEHFDGTFKGLSLRTHHPRPTIAGWVCGCGARGWLYAGASAEDHEAFDESAAEHDDCADLAAVTA